MMNDETPVEPSVPAPATPAEPPVPEKDVARLFPFVLKTRGLLVGREALHANKGHLHFVLIAEDIAEASKAEVLKDFAYYPVVQHFTAEDLAKFFNVKGAKAVGFTKSGLAQSIYAELKSYRINQPMTRGGRDSQKAPVQPVKKTDPGSAPA
jgi:ribosomal protein L7Ae-like RNA K-turn-binding protein